MSDFEQLRALLQANRTIRRFDNSRKITMDELNRLVDLTRYCASGRNLQPLCYRVVISQAECDALFPALKWAGYYQDWDGPAQEERPVAYLIQCLDSRLTSNCLCDDGLQLEAITLGATSLGLGACIIKSFNKEAIMQCLNLAPHYMPIYILALGYPAETARIVPLDDTGDIKYYRNDKDEQCVPKRPLSALLITGSNQE